MDLSKSYEFFQPEKDPTRIHIVGCGSVGSTLAENLARYGVTKMTLWDFDDVEPHNLANQMFTQKHIGKPKTEALLEILSDINPEGAKDIQIKSEGWKGQMMTGHIFLCVDNIDLRREIVEKHFDSPYVKTVLDFRTRLEDAQHYAADWTDFKMKKDLLNSMQFTHAEAKEETPVSACNIELGVCATVRLICAAGVANFINFQRGKPLKKMMMIDTANWLLDAF